MGRRAAAAAVTLLSITLSKAAGDWVLAKDTGLCERHLCTASNYTWETVYNCNPTSGCAMLARKGITSMQLYGDFFGKFQAYHPPRLALELSVQC